MRDPAYAAYSALDPFFDIVRQGLAGLVDGDHYFDTIAPDAVFEFRYRFPGYPTKVVGREALSFPKIISGRIDDVARPGLESLQWRQTVGRLDVTAHLFVMPSAYALDCNTLHRRKESGVGAPRRR